MKKIVMFAFAACILAACTPKDFAGTETAPAIRKTFKAGIEDATRTYVDGLNVCWAEDDAISIFDFNTANSKYVYAGTPGETNGVLEYESDPGSGDDIDAIYAVYPYSENHIYNAPEEGDWAIWFSQVQTYAANSFGPGANVMVAKSQTESLMFKNVCGYLNLKLYSSNSSPISYIELKGNNSETISGYGVVTASEDSDPSVSMLSDYGYQNVYIYDPSGNLALSSAALSPTEIWIALPPTTFRRGITLTIYNENGDRFVKSTTKKLEIKRGTVKSTNALNVQYQSLASESEVAEKLEGAYEGVLTTYFEEDPITDTLYFQALPDDYHADYGNVYITGSLAGLYFSYALGNMYGDEILITSGTSLRSGSYTTDDGEVVNYDYVIRLGTLSGGYVYFSDDDIKFKIGDDHKLTLELGKNYLFIYDSTVTDSIACWDIVMGSFYTYLGALESPSSSVAPSATIGTPRMAVKHDSNFIYPAPVVKAVRP